jgi:hypothetical protein
LGLFSLGEMMIDLEFKDRATKVPAEKGERWRYDVYCDGVVVYWRWSGYDESSCLKHGRKLFAMRLQQLFATEEY